MTYAEFVQLVAAMRRAQRRFFATRNPDAVGEAKALEKKCDDAVAEYGRPAGLFDAEAGEGGGR